MTEVRPLPSYLSRLLNDREFCTHWTQKKTVLYKGEHVWYLLTYRRTPLEWVKAQFGMTPRSRRRKQTVRLGLLMEFTAYALMDESARSYVWYDRRFARSVGLAPDSKDYGPTFLRVRSAIELLGG